MKKKKKTYISLVPSSIQLSSQGRATLLREEKQVACPINVLAACRLLRVTQTTKLLPGL